MTEVNKVGQVDGRNGDCRESARPALRFDFKDQLDELGMNLAGIGIPC